MNPSVTPVYGLFQTFYVDPKNCQRRKGMFLLYSYYILIIFLLYSYVLTNSVCFRHVPALPLRNFSFTCDICGRAFVRAAHRKRHMLVHTGKKDFVCTQCGKELATKDGLKRHVDLVHLQIKKFTCTGRHCGRRFSSYLTLCAHSVTHG